MDANVATLIGRWSWPRFHARTTEGLLPGQSGLPPLDCRFWPTHCRMLVQHFVHVWLSLSWGFSICDWFDVFEAPELWATRCARRACWA